MPDSAEASIALAVCTETNGTPDRGALPFLYSVSRGTLSFVVILLVLVQAGICWKALPASLAARVDFRAFYTAGYLLVHGHGHELFSYSVQRQTQNAIFPAASRTLPFLYPAYVAPLFAPFALLSFRPAFVVFLATNLLLLTLALRLLCKRVNVLNRLPWWQQAGLAAAFFPISTALMQGQISILLLLLYVVFDRLLRRERHLAAGVVLALGLAKFQLALPVALLFLGWGFYRLIGGFLAGSAGVGVASLVVSGTRGMAEYWHNTTAMASKTLLDPAAAKLRYGMFPGDMPNLHGFFFTLAHGRTLGAVLAAAASIVVMLWAWRQRPSVAVALPAAMLVSYHMQAYDLVLLLLPLALLLPAKTRERRVLLIVSVVLLTAPLAALLVVRELSSILALAVVCVLIAAGRTTESLQQIQRSTLLIDEKRSCS